MFKTRVDMALEDTDWASSPVYLPHLKIIPSTRKFYVPNLIIWSRTAFLTLAVKNLQVNPPRSSWKILLWWWWDSEVTSTLASKCIKIEKKEPTEIKQQRAAEVLRGTEQLPQ